VFGSPWVGLKHFKAFFTSPSAFRIVRNTLTLNIYGLLYGFPVPIIFAVLLCETKSNTYRKIIQTVSYLPYFISAVITAGIVNMILNVDGGALNSLVALLSDRPPIHFLTTKEYFRTIYVITGIWQGFGWTAIIYISAILSIDQQLYEATIVDGAGALRRVWYITLPGIMSTIVIMLLLNIGNMMSSSFELVYLLQEPITYEVSDTIATYVYRRGIANSVGLPEYSFSTAIGLFQSVINTILLVSANFFARKYTESSLF
jgi:putative aldouronate transport system permease protein